MKNKILKLNEKLEWEEIHFQAEDDVVSYKVLSEAIGGSIEHITFNMALDKCNIDVWIDEEGKIKGLPLTTSVIDKQKEEIVEVLAGPLVFTGKKNHNGESYGLTDGQIEIIKQVFCEKAIVSINGLPFITKVLPYK